VITKLDLVRFLHRFLKARLTNLPAVLFGYRRGHPIRILRDQAGQPFFRRRHVRAFIR
jgi:hypothetical protein